MPRVIRILIIEDNPDDARLILLELQRCGIEPTWIRVETEAELRAAFAAGAWDAVLSDYRLPSFAMESALTICKQLDPDLPFIIISGAIGEVPAVAAMRQGASDFLLKGNLARLAPVLERELREAQGRRARRHAEHATEEQLVRAALILASVRESVMVADMGGIITYWNEGSTKLFGWTAEEMLGRPVSERVPEKHRGEVFARLASLRLGNEIAGEREDYRKDGTRIWVQGRISPIFGRKGEMIGFLGLAHDITDRRQAEDARRASEARFRAIIENTPDCIKIVAADGTLLQMNRAGLAMIEASTPDEVIGKSIYNVLPPECHETFRLFHEAVCRGQRETLVFDIVGVKGGRRTVQSIAVPLDLADGSRVHLAITRDITEARRIEGQLRQAQKMDAIGQLAGGIAHDFNNLLTIINGYSDILLQDVPRNHPHFVLLSEIRNAGERSASLTRQLLAFSRKQIISPRILDVNMIVTDAEKMLRRIIGEDIRLATSLKLGIGHVRADEGQLQQVLMNLAVNARDAMPTGGRLTIETDTVELGLDYARAHAGVSPGPQVLLTVSDTGCGMTDEVKAHIFEPFFTTKEVGKGTGLGLAVVHGIVQQSGGHINVCSEVGKGTTFKLYLPQIDAQLSADDFGAAVQSLPRGTQTILVVEDEDGVRSLLQHVLSSCGYTVLTARNGEEAMRVAAVYKGTIHLLLTDVVMPEMGGRQLSEQMLARRRDMCVLYISGYTDDAVVKHGILDERVHFLQKPFSPQALAFKVRDVLASFRLETT